MKRRTLLALLAAAACGGGDQGAAPSSGLPDGTASFARLQTSVLTPSCAVSGCHVSASAASSGNLILTSDVAYNNLVGVTPSNLAAARDGMKRIAPSHPENSLLFQKIVLTLA